jgi:hypothetical protein
VDINHFWFSEGLGEVVIAVITWEQSGPMK